VRRRIKLTRKLFSVDGLPTRAISPCEVAPLEHEVGNDTVEFGSFVSKTMLPSSKLAEVLRGFRDVLVIQLEDDAACGLAVHGDIKLDSD